MPETMDIQLSLSEKNEQTKHAKQSTSSSSHHCMCEWVLQDAERRLRALKRSLNMNTDQLAVFFHRVNTTGECSFAHVVGTNPPRCNICHSGTSATMLTQTADGNWDDSNRKVSSSCLPQVKLHDCSHVDSSHHDSGDACVEQKQKEHEANKLSDLWIPARKQLSRTFVPPYPRLQCFHARTHFNTTPNTKRNVTPALFILFHMGIHFPLFDQCLTPAWRSTQPICRRGIK